VALHYTRTCAALAVALFCQVFLCLDAIYEARWGESLQHDEDGMWWDGWCWWRDWSEI